MKIDINNAVIVLPEQHLINSELKQQRLFNSIAKRELKKLRKQNFENLKSKVFEINFSQEKIFIY